MPLPATPWSGDIKCAACGHVEATITLKRGPAVKEAQRQLVVHPSAQGKMNLRRGENGSYWLICAKCGSQTPYPAEVWRGFM